MNILVLVLATLTSISALADPRVSCAELRSGAIYPDGRTAKFFKINLAESAEVKVGPLTGFGVKDQDDKEVPEVAATITAEITRVVQFYEVRETLPAVRGQTERQDQIRKVFAVQAHLKSTDYELDWKSGGDYSYPDKEMTRDLFCTSRELVKAPAATP